MMSTYLVCPQQLPTRDDPRILRRQDSAPALEPVWWSLLTYHSATVPIRTAWNQDMSCHNMCIATDPVQWNISCQACNESLSFVAVDKE